MSNDDTTQFMEEVCPDADESEDVVGMDYLNDLMDKRKCEFGNKMGFDNFHKIKNGDIDYTDIYFNPANTEENDPDPDLEHEHEELEHDDNENEDDDSDHHHLKKDQKIFQEHENLPGSSLLLDPNFQNFAPSVDHSKKSKDIVDELIQPLKELQLIDGGKIKIPVIWSHSVDRLSAQDLIKEFELIYDQWCGESAKKIHPLLFPYAIFHLNINESVTEEVIEKTGSFLLNQLISFYIAIDSTGLFIKPNRNNNDNDNQNKDKNGRTNRDLIEAEIENIKKRFNRLIEIVHYCKIQLVASARFRNVIDQKNENSMPSKMDMFHLHPMNVNNLDNMQKLYLFIQRKCAENKLRKKGEYLFKERYVKSSRGKLHGTYHFTLYKTIQQFIIEQCNPRTNFDMWQCYMENNNLKKVADMLEIVDDVQLPNLKQDRTVSAWKNGLYFAEYNAFLPYGHKDIPTEGVCACVYIDQKFDNTDYGEDFMKIPCIIKQILFDQGFDEYEQSFVLAMLGRLIFKPGKYDRWEILAFLWGLAGTGKSCIIEACMRYFDPKDVAGVGNSIEKQFGLSPLVGKNLWVGMDIKKNFGMDAGDIQTITSLELMSVAVKYKDAMSVEWDVPGIIAGNEIPRTWTDTLQALARRILIIQFPKMIKRDNSIKQQLKNEHSLFYRITVSAYHWWQKRFGTKDIWQHAPKKFVEGQKVIREHENPLEIFLNTSESVVITKDEDNFVPLTYFNTWFRNWCTSWGHKNKLNPEELIKALATRGVKCRMENKKWHPQMSMISNDGTNDSISNSKIKSIYQDNEDKKQALLSSIVSENKPNNTSTSTSGQTIVNNNNINNITNNNRMSDQWQQRNEKFLYGILMNAKSVSQQPQYQNMTGVYNQIQQQQQQR